MSLEKYKELYMLSKEALNEEMGRFARIDEKASKYLSILTLLAGSVAYFEKWVIENLVPPITALEWILVILATILCAGIFLSWFFIFNSMRLHSVTKPPLNDEMIKFFDDNKLIDIYYALTKGNKEALRKNRVTTDRKSKQLYYGYNTLITSGVVLVAFLTLFFIYSWNNTNNITKAERSIAMTKSKDEKPQTTEKPSSDKPNPNIVPPTYDIVTEGYDPSKVQIKKGGKSTKKK